MGRIRKTFSAEVQKAKGEKRTLYVKISSPNPDRSGDVVIPKGVILDNFNRNPVVAAFHRYDRAPIGKAEEIRITDDGITAKVVFTPKGVNPEADMIYELNRGGYMNAWSIGFMPKDWDERPEGGRLFKEWELYEFSAVLVPDNPDALTMVRSKGFDPDKIIEEQKKATKKKKVKKDKNKKEEKVETIELSKDLYDELTRQAKQLQEILAEEFVEEEEEKDPTKEFLKAVQTHLRQSDKHTGLALRLLNTLKAEKGGE